MFISNEPPQLETIANDVLSVNKLNILDFNCKYVLTCGPLFKEIENHVVNVYYKNIGSLTQRHLLNEISDRFSGVGKAVDSTDPIPRILMPRGCEGTAILWKQELDSFITPLSVGTDRIQVNEVLGEQNLIILSVYMPCKGTSDHLNELNNCIDQLHEIMVTYKNMHQIIIVGDFNEDFVNGKNSKKTQH